MPRLIAALLRHGLYQQPAGVPSAHLPHPLTDEGRGQARAAAPLILAAAKQHGCVLERQVHASRLLRAWQTAGELVDALGEGGAGSFEVIPFDALMERGLGSAANLTVEQIEQVLAHDERVPEPLDDWRAQPGYALPLPGAESLLEAGERVAAHLTDTLDELAARATTDTMQIFVGHGGSIRYAAVACGLLEPGRGPSLSMPHCQPMVWELLGDGSWRHLGGEWKERTPRT
jgi:2,3-bisphosphoglycerate-dependent phosphoglycerate mutase